MNFLKNEHGPTSFREESRKLLYPDGLFLTALTLIKVSGKWCILQSCKHIIAQSTPQYGCLKWSYGNKGAGMEGKHSHSLAPGTRVRAINKLAVWFGLFVTITLDVGSPRRWGEDKDSIYGMLVVIVQSIQNFFAKLFLK